VKSVRPHILRPASLRVSRVANRRRQQLLRQSGSAMFSTNEEAGNRPELLRRFLLAKLAQTPERVERSNGAPGHGFSIDVAEQAHRHTVADAFLHKDLPSGVRAAPRILRVGPPGHAPAVARTTACAEQLLEIVPAV